jgi:retron-type reverse transcriptase
MKRLGGLWPRLIGFENLLAAYGRARRGKRHRTDCQTFALCLEENLFDLQRELAEGTYRPGAYRLFTVYERKPRLIAAAPFRDRVVHHAIMRCIEPPIDRRFIHDSYACRPGKGVHAAVDRYQQWARRYAYVLKLDISRYFPSIDRLLLKESLRRYLKDRPVLGLLDRIIDQGPPVDEPYAPFPGDDLLTPLERPRGIPIGNLTSQFFANLYLDRFDHWLLEEVRVAAYLRYVDDLYIMGDDAAALWAVREAIREYLAGLRLHLHPLKARVHRTSEAVEVLGYRVSRERRWLRNDNGYRFQRRFHRLLVRYRAGRLDWPGLMDRVQPWIGHARHAETAGLRLKLFGPVVFYRDGWYIL